MPEVCLVIPCFNEASRLDGRAILALLARDPSASVCLVDDGSSDGTVEVLEALRTERPTRILVHRLPSNRGKAEAVRQGVRHVAAARGPDFVGYWDADFSTPLEELERLLDAMIAHPGCLMALGSRVKRLGSQIDRRTVRHVLGRAFSTCANAILEIPVYDSQCGAKLFRIEAVEHVFAEPFVTRWCFDLEILVRLRNHLGTEAFRTAAVEVPLGRWREVSGSKLGSAQMLKIPLDLLRIREHYRRSGGSGRSGG